MLVTALLLKVLDATLALGRLAQLERVVDRVRAQVAVAFARARRSTLAATNAKIDQSVRTLRG